MKKRILNCLMALALCLTLLPTAALAEETEGTAQTSPAVEKAADPANGEAKQEGQPAEAKQESQPAEAKQENQPAEQEEQQEDSAAKQAVAEVQAMIDALPDAAELDGMDDEDAMAVYEAFQTACEAYYDTLSEKQQAQLKNTEKLAALSERFSQLETLAAGDTHTHCVCGKSVCAEKDHGNITFGKWLASTGYHTLDVGEGDAADGKGQTPDSNGKYVLPDGNYYLKTGKDVTIEHPIQIKGTVTICLNGQTIQSTAEDQPVFEVVSGTLTLTDCKSNQGKVTSAYKGGGVEVNGGTFNLYGGSITKNKAAKGGGVYMTSGTVNMYGGEITGNTAAGSAEGTGNGGGVYMSGGTFHMRGGSITDNTTDVYSNGEGNGGGVYVAGGTFNLYDGGSITNNKVIKYGGQNRGGGVHVGDYGGKKGTFNMSGGEISDNEAKDGGGGVCVRWHVHHERRQDHGQHGDIPRRRVCVRWHVHHERRRDQRQQQGEQRRRRECGYRYIHHERRQHHGQHGDELRRRRAYDPWHVWHVERFRHGGHQGQPEGHRRQQCASVQG